METKRYDANALDRRYESRGYWSRRTLGDLLRRSAATHGDAPALVDGDLRLSYAALERRVDEVAAGFARIGVVAGDRILLQLPNGRALVVCLFALARLGALPIMAMPAQRERDIDALCRLAEPVGYVIPRRFLGFDYLALAERMSREHASLKHVLVDGDPGPWTALDQIEDRPREFRPPSYKDTALLLLSGGTTGIPKLIPRRHTDYLYNALESARLCGLAADSVYLCALPAAHNFPLACPGILGTLGMGGRVVMAPAPGPDEAFPLIAREAVTHTALVPSLAKLWVEARAWDDSDLSSLSLLQVGGARLEPDLARRIGPALGCRLQQVFGMAEGLLCYTRLDDPQEVVLNTQGRPLCPDDELRILGSDGRPVPPGRVGELQVRGPYTIRGYYRAPEQNAVSFTEDGFYRSGDLVRVTDEGNLVVEGRIKEQINRAGEKIAAAEIERPLREHPGIEDCVIAAIPDERLGERICAFVIGNGLGNGRTPALAEVQAFLGEAGLPRYKLPDQLLEVETWPLTTVGKIDRQRLTALALREPESRAGGGGKRAYARVEIGVRREPIELLVALARSGFATEYAVYEQPGEWSMGLGRAASVVADHARVVLHQDGERQAFRHPRLVEAVAAATGAIRVEDWRAYGVASFELSRVFHGLPPSAHDGALIDLFVPECEIRIREGRATLRAIDPLRLDALRGLVERLDRQAGEPPALPAGDVLASALLGHEARRYKEHVVNAVAEIRARQYQKVILSRRIPLPPGVDVPSTYLAGRACNTPARSFLLRLDGQSMAGFSPETVVEVSADGWVSTQPLAGTRALGNSREEEERLRMDLLHDPKEVAEHAVSVKLASEELASVCQAPSIGDFMSVLRRGTVQHLASRVGGRLEAGRGAWDAFEALFPAVTASGIPKQASIAAIQRFERIPRGWYSGCAMVVDCHGGMDAALVLRSVFQRGTRTWLQAGAGIVSQSRPERELEETSEKLGCILKYVVVAPSPQEQAVGEAVQ